MLLLSISIITYRRMVLGNVSTNLEAKVLFFMALPFFFHPNDIIIHNENNNNNKK